VIAPELLDHEQDRAFLRPFRLGLLGVAILFVLIGSLIAAFGTGADRPEGVAERWLANVGDTTRDGVKERARREAEEVGPLSLARHLLPEDDTDGRAAFPDLEVGKAVDGQDDGTTEVPFRLHQRIDGSSGPAVDGVIVLRARSGDDEDWEIVGVEAKRVGLEVPSEGGSPAAEAPAGLFAGAIGVSLLLAGACALAVRAASGGRAKDPA
jgi:hypothetical protein